jgi:hypothetical protein
MSGIGVLREGPLHAAIKRFLAGPEDRFEVPVDRFVVDLVRADGELVEIQTGGFAALGPKLDALLDTHRMRVVHPVAAERRIVRVDADGEVSSTRRSPKRATVLALFEELVSLPSLLTHPNLTLEVLLLREDHIRAEHQLAPGRSRRDPGQRRLIEVLERVELRTPDDMLALLPTLPDAPFTTRELAARLGCGVRLAQRTAYCLRAMGVIETAGKRGRAPLHQLAAAAPASPNRSSNATSPSTLITREVRWALVHTREPQPTFIPPMLLSAGPVPEGEGWTYELKWDGCRAQLRHDGRSVSLRTRHGRECTSDFPELGEIASALGSRRVTLDGELVCLDVAGRPDFARLRRRLTGASPAGCPAMFQAFDLLHLDGRSTLGLRYTKRRALLEELALDGPGWRTPASLVVERVDDFVSGVEELGLEGVVAKRRESRYLPGRRSKTWVKHKLRRDEQLAVTGIRRTPDGRVDAVWVARPRGDGSFAPAGSIELGLQPDLVDVLEQRLAEMPPRRRGRVTWYPAEVSVLASVHGPRDRPVRDAILRGVVPT